ncbi:flagellar export protein FliJ [Thermosyntropha sp.]|uniref:flagellar export protein FliJ n=1 Tax=Thermosyntropha sp. TaxID=2740820 RepID=UPI0025EF59CE|nr:flagellar export protein FliJ [Thermosyntropha sp.]MBO8159350.1 flagellar export protein FliJ [Thermosyntropha sp.]
MKPFKFKLQVKLDISSREEAIAREKLQLKIREKESIEAELNFLESELVRVENIARNAVNCAGSVYLILMSREYIPILKEQISQCRQKLARVEEELEKLKSNLIEKRREVKTLEKIKEREWLRYLHDLNLEEQKFIDEVAGNSYFRKQKNKE